jgi:hypothetical protein
MLGGGDVLLMISNVLKKFFTRVREYENKAATKQGGYDAD